jgi:hypothetical protein
MRKASTRMPEQGTQAPSPAPDLIPAKQLTENLHKDWNSERGHITSTAKHCVPDSVAPYFLTVFEVPNVLLGSFWFLP